MSGNNYSTNPRKRRISSLQTSPNPRNAPSKLHFADIDNDSTMHSDPDLDEGEEELFPDADNDAPSTPHHQSSFPLHPSSELSPPNSQGPQPTIPTGPSATDAINANGKRLFPGAVADAPAAGGAGTSSAPLAGILNSTTGSDTSGTAGSSGTIPTQTHAASGYTWNRPEDAPGYSWQNKKATEEYQRAYNSVVEKDRFIGNRYSDPLDEKLVAIDKEMASRA